MLYKKNKRLKAKSGRHTESSCHGQRPDLDDSILVIHPADPTTDFLTEVHRGRQAITTIEPKNVYRSKIERAKRTLLFGHGFPQGLFGGGRIIIDDSFAGLFAKQPNNIYIWCNADCYLRKHGLHGFATGMFISEPLEAHIFNVDAKPDDIDASNTLFSRLVREAIDLEPRETAAYVLDNYRLPGNPVVEYNRPGIGWF